MTYRHLILRDECSQGNYDRSESGVIKSTQLWLIRSITWRIPIPIYLWRYYGTIRFIIMKLFTNYYIMNSFKYILHIGYIFMFTCDWIQICINAIIVTLWRKIKYIMYTGSTLYDAWVHISTNTIMILHLIFDPLETNSIIFDV